MQLNAHVDVELVAVEQPDELTVLLELRAPEAPPATERPPAAVQVVLDRSGSMAGERLEAAQRALVALVDRLDPRDRFGVVAFDDAVQVVVPAGAARATRPRSGRRSPRSSPGGMTNLSGGLLRGLQEARRVAGPARRDAAAALRRPRQRGRHRPRPARRASPPRRARARRHDVDRSASGSATTRRCSPRSPAAGQGGHAFAEDGDAAAAAVAGEVDGLLVQDRPGGEPDDPADRRRRRRSPSGTTCPSHGVEGGVVVELGDLWAGEERKLLLTLARAGDAGARPRAGRDARAALRRAARAGRADRHAAAARQRRARRRGRRARPRPEGPHRAALPAGPGGQAPGRGRARARATSTARPADYRAAARRSGRAAPSAGARRRRRRSSSLLDGSRRRRGTRLGGQAQPDGARGQVAPAGCEVSERPGATSGGAEDEHLRRFLACRDAGDGAGARAGLGRPGRPPSSTASARDGRGRGRPALRRRARRGASRARAASSGAT